MVLFPLLKIEIQKIHLFHEMWNGNGISVGKNWFLLEPALSAPGLLKNQVL